MPVDCLWPYERKELASNLLQAVADAGYKLPLDDAAELVGELDRRGMLNLQEVRKILRDSWS